MTKRDIIFVSLVLGGLVLMGANLAPTRAKPRRRELTPVAPLPDVVERLNLALGEQWKRAGVKPTPRAADLTVIRRVSLALTGSIPSLEEIRQIETWPSDQRLSRWIEELVSNRRASDYIAERLARAYVGVEGGPFLVYRRRRFVTWLSDQVQRNRPYDEIVRDLIAGQGLWTDHPSTNFITVTYDPDRKIYDPERLAARSARAFLGARIDCAQCHDHPFQPWKRDDFRGIAAYFGQVEQQFTGVADGAEEFIVEDRKTGKKSPFEPRVPFLPELDTKVGTRRERLARWVTDPRNEAFSRVTVNRAWAMAFGRPLVEPVDDLGSVSELPESLKILAEDFAQHHFDFRRLMVAIVSSDAFNRDSAAGDENETTSTNQEAAWASFPLTRLRPEQVAGALLQASRNETLDGDTHILIRLSSYGDLNQFVTRHGDPGEEEFNLEPSSTIPQRLLMMNGELVWKNIKEEVGTASGRIAALAPNDEKAVEVAYLVTLTRKPTPEELRHFTQRLSGTRGDERKRVMTDLVWSLLNATEFSWNH